MSLQESTPRITEEVFTPGTSSETITILSVCKQYLDGEELHYLEHQSTDGCFIKALMAGINGSYEIIMDIKEPKKLLIIYVRTTLRFPIARRGNLAEFLTRSNYGLVLGCFEMDMNDGEVRYKCSVPTTLDEEGNTSLTGEVVDRMMQATLVTMDRYFSVMVQVGYGIKDPKEAVESVEENSDGYVVEALQQLAAASSGESSNSGSADSNPTDLIEGFRQLLGTSGTEERFVTSSQ